MKLFVGIDSSVHSTGLAIRSEDNTFSKFYVITSLATEHSATVSQVVYEHLNTNTKKYTDDDLNKIKNGMKLGSKIVEIIERNRRLTEAEEVHIAMEGSVMSFGFKGSKSRVNDLVAYNSCIKYKILTYQNKNSFNIFAPKQVKKLYTGNGNANKQNIIDKFKQTFPEYDFSKGKNDDVCDAYALSCCAEKVSKS